MLNRSFFVKINKLNIKSIEEAINVKDYIESCICYIVNKTLINNCYSSLDVRFQYDFYKITNSFNSVEEINISSELLNNLVSLHGILEKNIEQIIDEFYMFSKSHKAILNINCMLVNADSLLVTYEVFFHSNNGE